MPEPELLTVEEVAALLRTTPAAIYMARQRGQAPASLAIRIGRRLLWRRTDIDAWLDARFDETQREAQP